MVHGQIFDQHSSDNCFININVGGFKQRMEHTVLQRFPQTRLGRLLCCSSKEAILELCDDFSPSEMEYYFDRSPRFFCYVLHFYFTGKIHLVDGLCVMSFCQEIEYWGIKERHLDFCCSNKFHELMQCAEDKRWDQQSDEVQLDSLSTSIEDVSVMEESIEMFEGTWCADVRKQIWIRLENPGHSTSAKAMAITSLSVVLISIAAMCVHSMPDFHKVDVNDKDVESPVLTFFENLCVLFFTAEFILRLAVAPSARRFLCRPLNIIDLMSVMPFYVTVVCDILDDGDSTELEKVGKVVQILRLMRVFRILKLARHSTGLRSLGATLRHSSSEVGQLVLFLSVGISVFSTLIYFVERESEESELQTVPICWWWATISMTTVGYGDTFPVTLAGRVIGALCIICGLLIVALPITNIFNKFSKFYQKQKQSDK
ncbi:potassium voltage-gated channel subfamily S member 3-like [Solea senegalensis]|uniref:Potassium voltage-gated channel subfamily S member 3-like n=1 Tax=Solea senegalensis TaxID=28829 RepID=A0AAV6RXP2_SOLSE|nr:potassium voltage-gated channel subfamily S member 3-like [Solea senegalensis]XP_043903870.1 potassium voltage-gated channel subfamily S member 3-like [Solea senegalensis]KAG7510206.1 potassium voltage-gated channel subfamily S member 3-like [Solea senegalensis]